MLGFFFLKSAIMASRPSCSPAPVHHEQTSTWPISLGGSFAGSLAAVAAGSLAASLEHETIAATAKAAHRASRLLELRRMASSSTERRPGWQPPIYTPLGCVA